ncbi:zinc finger and BTB domain-containing protein 9-like, partial [Oxyura jamaicensis]|uniref:zinc finger and BTB domain-containing protein 9-like n=1 Tax=Oxyura jamaicensis TaxID=8884 RepID=UPI0015A6372A
MAAEGGRVQISFPQHAAALLDSLNRLRLEGKFCDVAVHVGGRVFPAHKSVLAAASPFFHDKLLLQDGGRLLLPPAIDPEAFEGLLHLIYSGRLTLLLEALPGHLLVASGLQMWHVVDQCSEILRELEGGPCRWAGRSGGEATASSSSSGRGGGGDAVPCGVRGGDGAVAASWPARGGEGAAWADTAAASFPKDGGDEVLKIRLAADMASAATSSLGSLLKDAGDEVLKICVEEDEEEEEEEGGGRRRHRHHHGDKALQIVLEEEEEEEEDGAVVAPPESTPKVFYVKQEAGDTAAIATTTAIATSAATFLPAAEAHGDFSPAEVSYIIPSNSGGAGMASAFPQPSWKPVDLHGNEILAQASHGQALHAPVKLGAAPDGKRFGCLCGKRFAVKPKRDRHIMLTFSLRPFACAACHKRFKLKHHLTEHMKTHEGAGRACERCGRRFRLRSGLAKHRPLCQGPRWGGGCWAC